MANLYQGGFLLPKGCLSELTY